MNQPLMDDALVAAATLMRDHNLTEARRTMVAACGTARDDNNLGPKDLVPHPVAIALLDQSFRLIVSELTASLDSGDESS